MFFYADKSVNEGFSGDVWKMDGTKMYLSHYSNMLYLQFVANHSLTSFAEKAQAEKEIKICQRKLDFWKRHPNYDQVKANEKSIAMKKQWEPK